LAVLLAILFGCLRVVPVHPREFLDLQAHVKKRPDQNYQVFAAVVRQDVVDKSEALSALPANPHHQILDRRGRVKKRH
jgi:hypothetical protein